MLVIKTKDGYVHADTTTDHEEAWWLEDFERATRFKDADAVKFRLGPWDRFRTSWPEAEMIKV